jgi:hypothetical protein
LGLKFGVHIMRGIPRAATTQNLPVRGTDARAEDIADKTALSTWSRSHYGIHVDKPQGQAYYDDYIALIASYDVDYIKADDLVQFPRELEAIAKAVRKTGRPITLSLSPGDTWDPKLIDVYRLGDCLRLTRDMWDKPEDLAHAFRHWLRFVEAIEDPADPGVWPDLDMIPFGHLRIGTPGSIATTRPSFEGPDRWSRFTVQQKRTFMTQRAMAASPLMIGGALVDMDEQSVALLTNRQMIACNQNAVVGRRVHVQDNVEVWHTPQRGRGGAGWIGVFNRDGARPARVALTAEQLGLGRDASRAQLENIWVGQPLRWTQGKLEVELGPDDVCFIRYQRP